MKKNFLAILISIPMFAFSQVEAKLERLNDALSKAEITEGKCGSIVQRFYLINGNLIYAATSSKCKKADSTIVSTKNIGKVESTYQENKPSLVVLKCLSQEDCMEKVSFLGNRSLRQTVMMDQLEIKTNLSKREFTNLVATLSQLNTN